MTAPDKPHALIVDDEQSYLDLLGVILGELLSCPVATFSRPAAALAALPNLNVGIIVTDFYMPELDGLEFLRRANAIKPGIPAVMITGHSEGLDQRALARIGNLRKVMAKPFGARVLAETILEHWPEAGRL